MNVSKVSEITAQDVAEYLRLSETTQDDLDTLNTLLTVAKVYVGEYTGRTIQDLDDYRDIIIVVLILCQDMWDNRTLYVEKASLSYPVETILGMHSINLL